MDRLINFRGKPNLNEERMEELKPYVKGYYDGIFVYGNIINNDWIVGEVVDSDEEWIALEYWIPVIPETVGQFTGLYDRTKWEDISEEEKQDFYVRNCSDDGLTIKYQTQEEVKHLWRGREIYEGDIVLCNRNINDAFDKTTFLISVDEYFRYQGVSKLGNEISVQEFECAEIIGNIHDNLELLEKQKEV